jgi:Tropinone reductase 1
VEELAEFGAAVHICSRNEDDINKCLEEWKIKGFNVTGSVCDLLFRDQREKLMETVSSIFHGKLNILVRSIYTFIYLFIYLFSKCSKHFSHSFYNYVYN